jgi:hypothetical protein
MPLILVNEKVLGSDQDASRTIGASRDGDEHVSGGVDAVGPLANDVIQPQIELVKGEHLAGGGRGEGVGRRGTGEKAVAPRLARTR